MRLGMTGVPELPGVQQDPGSLSTPLGFAVQGTSTKV